MKSTLLTLFCILAISQLPAQFKEQKINLLEKYHVAKYITFEDSILTENNAIIEVEELSIVFYKFMVDTSSCKVRVTGKVNHAVMGSPPGSGIPEIGIFKAIRNKNSLTKIFDLGNTSNDKSSLNNNGFFDIWFTIGKEESLYFYSSGFFLEEYKLAALLKTELHITCNAKKPDKPKDTH